MEFKLGFLGVQNCLDSGVLAKLKERDRGRLTFKNNSRLRLEADFRTSISMQTSPVGLIMFLIVLRECFKSKSKLGSWDDGIASVFQWGF